MPSNAATRRRELLDEGLTITAKYVAGFGILIGFSVSILSLFIGADPSNVGLFGALGILILNGLMAAMPLYISAIMIMLQNWYFNSRTNYGGTTAGLASLFTLMAALATAITVAFLAANPVAAAILGITAVAHALNANMFVGAAIMVGTYASAMTVAAGSLAIGISALINRAQNKRLDMSRHRGARVSNDTDLLRSNELGGVASYGATPQATATATATATNTNTTSTAATSARRWPFVWAQQQTRPSPTARAQRTTSAPSAIPTP